MTKISTALAACLVLGLAGGFAGAAHATTPGQDLTKLTMDEFGATRPPMGYIRLCRETPSACDDSGETFNANRVVLDQDAWRELNEVNRAVNAAVEPVTDFDLYGREEVWAFPQGYGDCEDYVLLKRHILMQRGWPAEALLITVVREPNGEGHAVLTVMTDSGDLILDNQAEFIVTWQQTPYSYEKRQSPNAAGQWVWLRSDRPGAEVPEQATGYQTR